MTRVDFYILAHSEAEQRLLFACRLVEKAFKNGHKTLLICNNAEQAKQLDELLWSYKESSFIPHQLLDSNDAQSDCPVEISLQTLADPYREHHDILINLSDSLLNGFSRFERCMEIVVQQQETLAATRKNYKFYKERGYPLHQHDMRK